MTDDERAALIAALTRQTENMAFLLNHANVEGHWYERFCAELEEDRKALSSSPPAAGWKDSVAPSLGSSEADALTQLLELSKKATPGPWETQYLYGAATLIQKTFGATPVAFTALEARSQARSTQEADAAFIVAAVNYVRSIESKAQDGSSLLNPSPPATAGDGWRPIESAPKDGTAVLLFFPKRYQGKGGVSWGCFVNGDWLDSRAIRDNDATHWMPLPAPPDPVLSNGESE